MVREMFTSQKTRTRQGNSLVEVVTMLFQCLDQRPMSIGAAFFVAHTRRSWPVLISFWVTVREWQPDRNLGKFCGRQGNTEPLVLESNQLMKVKFTTDSSVNRTGFAATYQTGK